MKRVIFIKVFDHGKKNKITKIMVLFRFRWPIDILGRCAKCRIPFPGGVLEFLVCLDLCHIK